MHVENGNNKSEETDCCHLKCVSAFASLTTDHFVFMRTGGGSYCFCDCFIPENPPTQRHTGVSHVFLGVSFDILLLVFAAEYTKICAHTCCVSYFCCGLGEFTVLLFPVILCRSSFSHPLSSIIFPYLPTYPDSVSVRYMNISPGYVCVGCPCQGTFGTNKLNLI